MYTKRRVFFVNMSFLKSTAIYRSNLKKPIVTSNTLLFKKKRTVGSKFNDKNEKKRASKNTLPKKERNLNAIIEREEQKDDGHHSRARFVVSTRTTSKGVFKETTNRASSWEDMFKPENMISNVRMLPIFFDIEATIIAFIRMFGKGKIIVGCIAWMLNKNILQTLIEYPECVLFVINEEDYFENPTYVKVVDLYEKLPKSQKPLCLVFSHMDGCGLREMDKDRHGYPLQRSITSHIRSRGSPSFCKFQKKTNNVDNDDEKKEEKDIERHQHPFQRRRTHSTSSFNRTKDEKKKSSKIKANDDASSSRSLMHLKFIVIFDKTIDTRRGMTVDMPRWTIEGSFNYTHNASYNNENVNIIDSKEISKRYFDHFAKIFKHSNDITFPT